MEALEGGIADGAAAGLLGRSLDYSGAAEALRKNPVFGVSPETFGTWVTRRAEAVAGEAATGLADEVQGLVEEAVREGKTLQEFSEGVEAARAARGLPSLDPARLETIFRTNVLAAYSGGQWARAKGLEAEGRVAAAEYFAVRDDRVRPNHLAMDGWWGPLDSPVWQVWWPPNGWNCRCQVRLLSPEEVEARGGIAAAPAPPAVAPDEGFEGNPGMGLWTLATGTLLV